MVSVTMVVGNSGSAAATGIVIQDKLLTSGAEYVSGTVLRGGGTFTRQATTASWTPGTVAAGDSAMVEIKLRVLGQGVSFNTAEITAMQGTDTDSQVDNQELLEDDYASICFSVPIYWYQGEEFEVTIPAGFKNTQWLRNNQAVTASTPSEQAAVRGDTLIIRSPGTYTFTTTLSNCPASGCCPIEVVQGPCGSIGDFVWLDTNYNGIQDQSEPGVANVPVKLYSQNADTLLAETTTNANGFYSFSCLPTGNYRVGIVKPEGTVLSTFKNPSGTPDKDSDGQDSGARTLSPVVPINVAFAENDKRRNNPDIDFGLAPYGSIGNFVWDDTNTNGFQDGGEAGISGVRVNLYASNQINTPIKSLLTNATGFYKFDSLQSGTYIVRFLLPSGKVFTLANAGTAADDERDSDAGVDGYSQAVQINASQPLNSIARTNMTIDAGVTPSCTAPVVAASVSSAQVCSGTSFTLTAAVSGATSGLSYRWSGPNGYSSTDANPIIASAALSATGVYSVTVSSGVNCASTASVTVTVKSCECAVTPPIISCATTNICPGDAVTLLAANCSGTVTWSNGQTGSQLIVSPSDTTTYTATCSVDKCTSGNSNPVTIFVADPKPPVIAASATTICPGTQVTLTATGCTGRVIWSTGATGTSLTVSPAMSTTYYANCRIANCISSPSDPVTIQVGTPPTPQVTVSKTSLCEGESSVLTILNCPGTPVWSTGDTTQSITVSPRQTTRYSVVCRLGSCLSPRSEYEISVTKPIPPTIVASSDTVCIGSQVTLTASGCQGTVLWSSGSTGATLTITPRNNVSYTAYCKIGTCTSEISNAVNIVVVSPAAPLIKSTKTLLCAGEDVTLTAEGCTGTVVWSNGMTGSSITDRPGSTTNYTAKCRVGSCLSESSNLIAVNVTNSSATRPTVTVSKSAICKGETVVLSATGCTGATIVWSTGETGASITVAPVTTTEYYAACRVGSSCNSQPAKVTITVNTPPTPEVFCSASRICPGETVVLSVGSCTGTPLWSTGATTSSITVSPTVTTSYTVVCRSGQCSSDPSQAYTISVEAPAAPVITASTLEFESGQPVSLSATGCGTGQVVWSTGATGTSIVVDPVATTSYYAQCRINNCLSDLTTITIKKKGDCNVPAPTVTVASSEVCSGGSATLTATGCTSGTIVWSNGMTGSSITVNNLTRSEQFTAMCKRDAFCMSAPSSPVAVNVLFINAPTIVSSKPVICPGDTTTLSALGCPGQIVWSTGETTGSIIVKPGATTGYWAKCKLGTCESARSPINTVRVVTPTAPTISASATNLCFGQAVTLTASACQEGYVIWSNGQVGQSVTVSPAVSTTFTAVCCTSGNCKSVVSNGIAINVSAKPGKPVTVDKVNTCPFVTVDLTTAVVGRPATGSIYEFRTGNTPTSPLVANPNAVGAGTYYVFEKTANGCYGEPSAINIQITDCNTPQICTTNPASATAGSDATLCDTKEYKLNGRIGGAATSAVWSSSGTGTFNNALLLDATYRASAEDVKAGFVTLTLTTNDPDGSGACVAAKASIKLTFKGVDLKPTITVQGNTSLCNGDSVVLKALPDGYRYRWNTNATTQSIVVKAGGSYFVTLLNAEGCTSVASEPVSITVNSPVLPPQVAMMARNTCPATTVSLVQLVESQPRMQGSSFEFRAGSSPASPIVIRPDSVGQGKYYIFERTAAGCYSAGAPVEVSIFNCATDSCRADLYIRKMVDKKNPRVGEVVTYTIKLGNKGTCAATHVDFRDILPEGLELVSNGNLAVDHLGHLTMWVTPLQAGEEREFFYKARVMKQGSIVNDVKITYLDQIDPDWTNNADQVTIQDTSKVQPLYVGLAKKGLGVSRQTDGTYAFRYSFKVTNYSSVDARKVQITDSLTTVFAPNSVTEAHLEATNSNLKFNSGFTGSGANVQLLDTASRVKAGDTESFLLTVKVRLVNEADTAKTFYNVAALTAVLGGTPVSDKSTDGDSADPDGDGNPNNNSQPTPSRVYTPATSSQLGVALAVVETVRLPDESYYVTYKITLKNFGTTPLTQVQLSDSLSKAITAPATFTVVGAPVVNAASTLVPNGAYNGKTNSVIVLPGSSLAAGVTDSVLVTVRIQPNGLSSVILNQVVGTAEKGDASVNDLSNNGVDPDPAGSLKTPVRFDLPPSLLGVAKSVGQPVNLGNGVYEVPYTIQLSNLGTVDLRRVQVTDNLAQTFEAKGALIVSNKIAVTAQTGLTVDTTYTGRGLLTKLLIDTLSTLPRGATRSLSFRIKVDVRNAQGTQFFNTAYGQALGAGSVVVGDTSTTGANPDPDNDLDPRNNGVATPVTLEKPSNVQPRMGVALSVKDTVRLADGSYRVVYRVIVKNFSSVPLQNVQLQDSLAKYVFNVTTGASYTVAGTPTVPTGSGLVPNPQFNGNTDTRLLLNTSTLAAGVQDTLLLTLIVRTDGRTTPYLNMVNGEGLAGLTMVRDVSTDGIEPDPNGNSDPTEATEGLATALVLPLDDGDVYIPQGFSPNGDGINDRFVIRRPSGMIVNLEVFNRWGHAVYRNEDYHNDWDGTANTGVRIGTTSNGLPDGTYYYIVRLSDGRRFVRYMTINR
nr:SdrD B-like domain-containing protein [Tellurirhabdus rosea]